MERRHFLKLAFGAAAGAGTAVLAASAQAAPLAPYPLAESARTPADHEVAHPGVTTTDEVNSLKPEQVRWHHYWHHHWHHRLHRHHWWHRHRWHRWHHR